MKHALNESGMVHRCDEAATTGAFEHRPVPTPLIEDLTSLCGIYREGSHNHRLIKSAIEELYSLYAQRQNEAKARSQDAHVIEQQFVSIVKLQGGLKLARLAMDAVSE